MADGERLYLVEEPKREYEGVRRLVTLPFIAEWLFAPLGLDAYFSWCMLRVNKQRLSRSLTGDVDILAGPLEWNDPSEFLSELEKERKNRAGWHPTQIALLTARTMADKGKIKWPPSTSRLIAIEAKCCYLDPKGQTISRQHLKSTKTSKPKTEHTRAQLLTLLRMGFDKVALLDIIANPPMSGLDGQAWFNALNIADLSRRAFIHDLNNRVPANSPVGHYVWSIGAIVGGDESQRGAGSPLEIRPAIQNPLLMDQDVRRHRTELEVNLKDQFLALPVPRILRLLFVDCEKCDHIHSDQDECRPQI